MRISTAQDLGNIVRDRRSDMGLTQAQLADRAGASRLWIHQIESGHDGASLAKVLHLLAALDLTLTVNEKPPSRLADLRARTP